jgi:bacillithiol system protein YtxJ
MEAPVEIRSIKEFESLLELSFTRPVLLFKFSPICPISSFAEDQFISFLRNNSPEIKICTIDVIHSKKVSREIAEKIGVIHKSPQAILIKCGKAVWNESHNSLTEEEFKKHI